MCLYPDAVVQRCLVQKERNLRGCLSRRDYPELNRLMNRLRLAQGASAAREALGDFKRFVVGKNRKALESVEEVGGRTYCVAFTGGAQYPPGVSWSRVESINSVKLA